MRKLIFALILLAIVTQSYANKTMNAQLSVWNKTSENIHLHCELLQKDVKIYPSTDVQISPNNSPAIELTFQNLGKLVKCTAGPAWFIYIVKENLTETVEISKLMNMPNFHYDSVYPGALVYE